MKRSERLARHYIRAADLRAVYLASRGRSTRIGITRDPHARARVLKGWKIAGLWWCASQFDADRLIAAVAARYDRVTFFCHERDRKKLRELEDCEIPPVAHAARLIPALARDIDVAISDDATVQKRAAAVVADIDQRVRAMQASGHLRGLNADYRAARSAAARAGVPFMSYGEYLARYKIKMLYELARLTQ